MPCPSPDTYLVLLDAGSVHTSIYTYRWFDNEIELFESSTKMLLLYTRSFNRLNRPDDLVPVEEVGFCELGQVKLDLILPFYSF